MWIYFLLFFFHASVVFCCDRVVSLSPSISDVVEVLGLTDQLVAVSTFDREIAAQHSLPVVGNLFELNSEALIGLKPSLVLLLAEQRIPQQRLQALGMSFLVVDHRTLAGIDESVTTIAQACGKQELGRKVLERLHGEMKVLRQQSKRLLTGRASPRVLIIIGGTEGSSVKRLFVSGKDGFYYQLLQDMGVEPIFHGDTAMAGNLSLESIVALKPTHILHILPPGTELADPAFYRSLWSWYPGIPAVVSSHVFARSDRFFSIPSVEYPRVLAAFVQLFLES